MRTPLWVVLIGVVQGALLVEGQLLGARHVWPVETFTGQVIWFTVIIGLGLTLQLLIRFVTMFRFWLVFGAIAMVLGGLAWYTGQTITSPKHAWLILRPFALTTGVGLLLVLTVVRTWLASEGASIRYRDLFDQAVEILFVVCMAVWFIATYSIGLFVISVFVQAWLIAVGVSSSIYIPVLKAAVLFPFAGLFSGTAIALGQRWASATTAHRHVLRKSCTWGVPVLALVQLGVAITALAIPQDLFLRYWAFTGHVLTWVVVSQVLILLAINGMYQCGETVPPPSRVTRVSVAILIVAGLLTCTLYVRWLTSTLMWSGWTLEAVWSGLVESLVAITLIGYLIASVERNRSWMRFVAPVNVAMASVTIVLAGLVNTPVLDPKRIVAHHQVHRVLDGALVEHGVLLGYGTTSALALGQAGLDAISQLARIEQHPRADAIRSMAADTLKELACGMKPLRGPGAPASIPKGNGRVYLVALDVASIPRVEELARHYQQDLNLSVETLLHPPLFEVTEDRPGVAWDEDRDQLVAEEAIALMTRQFAPLADDPETILIGLTNQDMHIRDSSRRFAFSFRYQDRFAIISSHQMDPATSIFRDRPNEEQLMQRIRKMTTKNIGMLYYRLPESGYRDSVLCEPITDIDDLDLIGEDF